MNLIGYDHADDVDLHLLLRPVVISVTCGVSIVENLVIL